MIKGKVLYLLVLISTSYLGILYYSPSLIGLAVLEFLLPLCSYLMLWLISSKIAVSVYLPIGVAEKNQPVSAGIEITNNSRIPIPRVRGKLRIQNRFYREAETVTFCGMAEGKSRSRLTVSVSASQCGPLQVEAVQVRIYDLFRLSGKKIPVKGKETLAVMPELYTASVLLEESTRDFFAESEEYDRKKPGDDASEIFQIREYRGGDRMQSIHWKLSARTDDLMVKEYSLPVGCAVVLFWDMEYQPEKGYDCLDEFIEAGIALSQGLLEAGCEHYAVWFNKNSQDIERLEMKEKDDIYLLIEQIFSAGPYPDPVPMEEIYREKYRGETWHTRLLINLKKELWKNGDPEFELSQKAREILENKELIL